MPGCDDVAQHELVEGVQHNVVKIQRAVFFHPGGGIGCGHPNVLFRLSSYTFVCVFILIFALEHNPSILAFNS